MTINRALAAISAISGVLLARMAGLGRILAGALVVRVACIGVFACASTFAVVDATLFCVAPACAETVGVDSIENSFPANTSNSNTDSKPSSSGEAVYTPASKTTRIAPLGSPLSGSVRVIDQVRTLRLKRAESTSSTADQSLGQGAGQNSGPSLGQSSGPSLGQSSGQSSGQSGGLADSGLQALFPSKDSFNPPPSLSGFAGAGSGSSSSDFNTSDQVKSKKKHAYIWNMSLAGGYYDVTNTFQGVVPGDKLYLYGGYMADGHTPVPSGPVPMNHGGHIRWTPIMGVPPD
ncbi:MAG: hypothetical protein Q8T09_06360 [Candidatus Melainabacteria bacterium]|nr:hypothetical protein [Candidatus Melainabacteria bacterium]